MKSEKNKINNHTWSILLLLLIFILGLAVRLFDLTDAPLDFHPTRQLHSALMARGMYYSITPDAEIPEWQRATSIQQWKMEGLVEPPILEWLVALTYRLAGGVHVWIARLYAIFFWMLAAIGIWLIAREKVGEEGALAGTAFFLIYPYGVYASRSFQPETLLVMLLVFSAWSALHWEKKQNWKWTVIAGILAGMAILVKAVAVFFVAGIWLGLVFSQMRFNQMIKNRQLWLIGLLCLLPFGLFLGYTSIFVSGYEGQFSLRFFSQMWTQIGFYLSWIGTLRLSLSLEWLLLGLLGILLIKDSAPRWMMMGAWFGYLLFGFTLPYHISSHDYYNLPMYLMVSIGLAVIVQYLVVAHPGRLVKIGMILVLLVSIGAYGYDAYSTYKRTNYDLEIAYWQDLGEQVGSTSKVVALSEDYGYRLAYWGWNSPANWMTTEDIRVRQAAGQDFDFEKYFTSETQGKDYFIVTLQDEFEKQPQLRQMLTNKFEVVFQDSRTVIFDLKTGS